jgi:TonB-linked SusC/RagA family outer membrane protein
VHPTPYSISRTVRIALALLLTAVHTMRLSAQEIQLADRGPRFLSAPTDASPPRDVRDAPAFRRRVTLEFDRVSLDAALGQITRQTGLRFAYDKATIPSNLRVSVHADGLTVASALYEILLDTDLDVQLTRPGAVAFIRRASSPPNLTRGRQATGVVVGRVSDARTGLPITGATVALSATDRRTITGVDGRYSLSNVPAGRHDFTARALGYAAMSRRVDVTTDSAVRTDFSLTHSVQALDEVVTTVTGDRSKLEVGNLIETIHADSVVATAPVTNLSDVLNARVAGVQVFLDGGLTGASPQINIRGQNSLTVSNQPLLVVDGVRVDNTAANEGYGGAGGTVGQANFNEILAGRWNDLDPQEIASIEVVKGPSAATLYGTDAANGVVLVTTKRGQVGAPRWDISAEQSVLTQDRSRFLPTYHAWGHTTDATHAPVQCVLSSAVAGTAFGVAEHTCVQDSVTHFSPLQDPSTTIVGTGNRQQYGLQISGGGGATRYFASGGYEQETAPEKLPGPDRAILAAERGAVGLEPDNVRPNALSKYSARGNLATALGPRADLTLTTGLLSQEDRIPNYYAWSDGVTGPGYRDAADGWRNASARPATAFATRNREDATHFTGGATLAWRPAAWLAAHGSGGLDYSSDYLDELARPGEDPYFGGNVANGGLGGVRANTRINIALYTADFGATATVAVASALTAKTSVGGQYSRRAELDNKAQATNLAPGTVTVAGGAIPSVSEGTLETAIAGGYVQEEFGWRDRLFATGALRADGGSTFGRSYKAALYPKASVSWLLSDEPWLPHLPGVSSLRLRSAYGASGVQPGPADALAQVGARPVAADGTVGSGVTLSALGNPDLKPERQTEFEAGLDLDVWRGRAHVAATYYNKHSTDALVNIQLPEQLAVRNEEVNIGSVRNRGVEVLLRATPIESRPLSWDVDVNGSENYNRLLSVGSVVGAGFHVGYPITSVFDRPILSYRDTNGDHIIEPTEVTVGSTPTSVGQLAPPVQLTVGSALRLFSDQLTVSVQVDRRSGFVLLEGGSGYFPLFINRSARALNDPTAPLRDQAAAAALLTHGFTTAGYYRDGSFTRLREVSLTYTIPQRMVHRLGLRSLSVTAAGRNLALWTRYPGADPEVNANVSGTAGLNNGAFVNSAAYYVDYGAPPPTRYWILRMRIGAL